MQQLYGPMYTWYSCRASSNSSSCHRCQELRELVRSLGRGGGKGPLRRAPEELEAPRQPPGVIRSPLQPEEVRGLTRCGAALVPASR